MYAAHEDILVTIRVLFTFNQIIASTILIHPNRNYFPIFGTAYT